MKSFSCVAGRGGTRKGKQTEPIQKRVDGSGRPVNAHLVERRVGVGDAVQHVVVHEVAGASDADLL